MDKFEGFKFIKIWKGAFNDLFKRGLKAYVILIGILFVFSFLGISGQYAFLDIDRVDDAVGTMQTDDYAVQFVTDYAMSNKLIQLIPELIREGVVMPFITANASYASWLLSVLMLNEEYVARNRGEVFVILVILSYAVLQFTYFIKRGFLVGQIRYQMECHVRKDVKIRRIMSPFSDYKYWHVFRVMAVHNLVLFLWGLTIIGGIIKSYQYYFVPYILAENPDVSWTQAKNLSKAMTKGYKFKMFIMDMADVFIVLIIGLFPFATTWVSKPFTIMTETQMYFTLRSRPDIDRSLFIETAFDDPEAEFKLNDFAISGSNFNQADKYKITDFIAMFFLFSFVGWVWEVVLHIVKDHALHNRGFLYGPWLPIYGLGGALIIVILSRFKANKPKLFVYTMVLCGILEYLTSFLIEFFYDSHYWDYHEMLLNLNGRVCLAGLVAFAIGGFAGVYLLGPMIRALLLKIGKKASYIVCAVLVAAFLVDVVCCIVFGPNSGEGVGKKYDMTISLLNLIG